MDIFTHHEVEREMIPGSRWRASLSRHYSTLYMLELSEIVA
jgi:hypothetical protein